MNISINKIIEIVQGQCLQYTGENKCIKYFCTDSRKIRKIDTSIFVALSTSSRDGHDFIAAAYATGLRFFLCSKPNFAVENYPDATIVLVNDTLVAMQQIAAYHRAQFNIPIVGITGSNGKTIIKEWLGLLLNQYNKVVKNPKSYNSQIGVPLAISKISTSDEIGIFEAGVSEPNEMAKLQKIIKPTIGLFTMIGAAHDANFEDTNQKIAEKLELFTSSDKLFFCSQHELIQSGIKEHLIPNNPDIKLVSWGTNIDDQLQILSQHKETNNTKITARYEGQEYDLILPYSDAAYIENAIHCWLIMLDFRYQHHDIAPLFLDLPPVKMRLELIKGINGCTLINDAYSSDIASLQIALDFLGEQKHLNKHSLIISDLAQQGNSDTLYQEVLQLLKEKKLYHIILIGDDFAQQLELFKASLNASVLHYSDTSIFLKQTDFSNFENEAILIKGARTYTLERVVNRLEEYVHRTVLNINLSALINNVNVFKKQLPASTKVMAMVKAFSYGSGSYEIASALEHHGVDYLAVAYVDEGILLRKKGIKLPILILNTEVRDLEAMQHYYLEPEIYSLSLLKGFIQQLKNSEDRLNIHIKLDTGMHRLGVEQKDLETFISLLQSANCFAVKSVFSHLVASADVAHKDFTIQQLDLFKKMSAYIEDKLDHRVIKHISNSGGAIKNTALQLDMVRLGIGLYGIDGHHDIQQQLQQIGRLKTNISQIKNVAQSETVGYGRAGTLQRDSRIATINIGYADGYSRDFGQGVGKVLIHNCLAPIVGNVCMDMMMVDVTDIPTAQENTEVIIFGPELTVTQLASWTNTIPYEIIAGISQRVKRIFYKE